MGREVLLPSGTTIVRGLVTRRHAPQVGWAPETSHSRCEALDPSNVNLATQRVRSGGTHRRQQALHTGPVGGRRATLCLANSSGLRHEHLPDADWLRPLNRVGVSPVQCCQASLTPFVQLAAAPSHSANTKPHWAGELLLGHESVDRGSPQARHLHDGWHAQEHRRCWVLCFKR